jgi:hypothetical protein
MATPPAHASFTPFFYNPRAQLYIREEGRRRGEHAKGRGGRGGLVLDRCRRQAQDRVARPRHSGQVPTPLLKSWDHSALTLSTLSRHCQHRASPQPVRKSSATKPVAQPAPVKYAYAKLCLNELLGGSHFRPAPLTVFSHLGPLRLPSPWPLPLWPSLSPPPPRLCSSPPRLRPVLRPRVPAWPQLALPP